MTFMRTNRNSWRWRSCNIVILIFDQKIVVVAIQIVFIGYLIYVIRLLQKIFGIVAKYHLITSIFFYLFHRAWKVFISYDTEFVRNIHCPLSSSYSSLLSSSSSQNVRWRCCNKEFWNYNLKFMLFNYFIQVLLKYIDAKT